MKNTFKDAKLKYQSVEIPKELDEMINKTINEANKANEKKSHKRKIFRTSLVASIMAFGLFVGALNTSSVFAQSISEIPLLGQIARIFTYVDYEDSSDFLISHVKSPAVTGLGDKKLEGRINKEISNKMTEKLEEMEVLAKEYYDAYIETGGTKEQFSKVEAFIDYELKAANEDTLSFVISQTQTLASAYNDYYYYNIDLKNNVAVTLSSLLGESYKEIINKSIKKQIEELKKDETKSFFEGENGFISIKDNQDFYINEQGNLVIVFDKYDIAPGYMGRLEFEIK